MGFRAYKFKGANIDRFETAIRRDFIDNAVGLHNA
jgi:hypothetical protein